MINVIITIVVLVPLFFLIRAQYRYNQKNIDDIRAGRKSLDDGTTWLRTTAQSQAVVISREVEINPKAPGIARVNLELEIRQPDREAVLRKTIWLVEVPSLPQVVPGSTVEVKFDPGKPERIFPAVPWARAWLFGKPRK